jgi:hypothetical protein
MVIGLKLLQPGLLKLFSSPTVTSAGYKEVTLLGQNIDAYGRDLPGMAADGSGRRQHTFTDLLRYVHDVPGIERIRFATSHPRYFTGVTCACTTTLSDWLVWREQAASVWFDACIGAR